ncbi:MAG: hypothetical protein NTX47_02760, partial [Candidatus Omnitrophica bacterium]|nr:hypothetical protein [Candidatus Omnitrophota bacterium]
EAQRKKQQLAKKKLAEEKARQREALKKERELEKKRLREEQMKQRELQRREKELLKERLKEERIRQKEEEREKKRLLKEQIKKEKAIEKEIQEPIYIERGCIKLVFDKPTFSFYYKGELISKNNFLDSSYVYGNRERKTEFEGLKVKVLQQSRYKIKLLLYKWNIPVQQIWAISLGRKGCISWDIDLLIKSRAPITNRQVIINMNDIFSRWYSEYETGVFDKKKISKDSSFFVRFTRPNARMIGVLSREGAASPVVTLVCRDKKDYMIDCSIEKSQTVLKALEINDNEEIRYSKGRHSFFKGEIYISNKRCDFLRHDKKIPIILRRNDLRFEFLGGTGKIFYKKDELTTGLGFYSAIFSDNKWIDSSRAKWKLLKKDKSGFTIAGYWAWVPLLQIWHIKIDKMGNILWHIEYKPYGKVRIDLEQMNLMLNKTFSRWNIAGKAQGIFPGNFENLDIDNYWERLYYGPAKNSFVETENGCNSILYKPLSAEKGLKIVVENSDNFYKGRVMQCRRISADKRKQKDFKAVISIKEVKDGKGIRKI